MPDPVIEPVVPTTPWYTGKADAEAIGYFQSRGWDKDPVHAALEAGKAHREAAKHIGVPPEQLLRLPKPEDSDGWEKAWQRLGKPDDPKKYDFSSVKRADGSALPDGMVESLRTTSAALNLPMTKAPELAKSIMAILNSADTLATAEKQVMLAKEKDTLRDNWKTGFEQNMLIAKRAAATLGMSPEQVQAIENAAGYATTMNLLRQLGTIIGEDKFITNDKGGPSAMTKEMAVAKIAELKADEAWRTRYLAGGTAEQKQMADLIAVQHA